MAFVFILMWKLTWASSGTNQQPQPPPNSEYSNSPPSSYTPQNSTEPFLIFSEESDVSNDHRITTFRSSSSIWFNFSAPHSSYNASPDSFEGTPSRTNDTYNSGNSISDKLIGDGSSNNQSCCDIEITPLRLCFLWFFMFVSLVVINLFLLRMFTND